MNSLTKSEFEEKKLDSRYNTTMKIRINKYLANLGLASRRKVDTWVDEKRVYINGEPATQGTKVDPEFDEIKLNNHLVPYKPQDLEYYLLYKPRQVVSTVKDPEGRKTVVSFTQSKQRLYPVGRLDYESEGLILLMNDGHLAQKLTHPRYHIPKTYRVWVTGSLNEKKLERFRNGIQLSDGMTAKAEISAEPAEREGYVLTVVLYEGRKRQIRRMCSKLKLEVNRLKRIAMGKLELGDMEPGEIRELSEQEIIELKK